jgi:predicted lipid carrier protein YhbT
MKPRDARHLFDDLLPAAIARSPIEARELNAIYCFKITGDDGGEWTVNCATHPPTCISGRAGNVQCAIEVSDDDFKKILADRGAALTLYFQGWLRVSGDALLMMKLDALLGLVA